MKLTKDQENALLKLQGFYQSKQCFFRLSGSAGTGKTTLMYRVCEAFSSLPSRPYQIGTAPTNKATRVLKKGMPSTLRCRTLYSALGIRMEADEDQLVLTFPQRVADLRALDVVYVDEAGMLPSDMVDYLKFVSTRYPRIKWIFSADWAQLNPVGEKESAIWGLDIPNAELNEVVRFDNQLLALATHIKDQVYAYPDFHLDISSNHDRSGGVYVRRRGRWEGLLLKAAKEGLFHRVDHTKAIAWRNAEVAQLNQLVRLEYFGDKAHSTWVEGDRVAIASPINRDNIKADVDDEGTISSVTVTHHTDYKELGCYSIVLERDFGGPITLKVVTEESEALLQAMLNERAAEAKRDKSKWGAFWHLKESFHKIRYGYAITAHRAQGSTYRNSFVAMDDILSNRNKIEALRAFYVAASRAQHALFLRT